MLVQTLSVDQLLKEVSRIRNPEDDDLFVIKFDGLTSSTPILQYLRIFKNAEVILGSRTRLQPKEIHLLGVFTQLRVLDLSNTYLSELPKCISKLSKLTVLFLHGNGITDLKQSIATLTTLPLIEVLTLYNNPISLTAYYRHYTVNRLSNIKYLDYAFVEEDERIEWILAEHSRPSLIANPMYQYITIMRAIEEDRPFNQGMILTKLKYFLSDIRLIHRKTSFVVNLQRQIRGYLARRKYKVAKTKEITQQFEVKKHVEKWREFVRVRKGIKTYLYAKSLKHIVERNDKAPTYLTPNVVKLIKKWYEVIRVRRHQLKYLFRIQRWTRNLQPIIRARKDVVNDILNIEKYPCFYISRNQIPFLHVFVTEYFSPKLERLIPDVETVFSIKEQLTDSMLIDMEYKTIRLVDNFLTKPSLSGFLRNLLLPLMVNSRIYKYSPPTKVKSLYSATVTQRQKANPKLGCVHLSQNQIKKFHTTLSRVNDFIDHSYKDMIKIPLDGIRTLLSQKGSPLTYKNFVYYFIREMIKYNAVKTKEGRDELSVWPFFTVMLERLSSTLKIQKSWKRYRFLRTNQSYLSIAKNFVPFFQSPESQRLHENLPALPLMRFMYMNRCARRIQRAYRFLPFTRRMSFLIRWKSYCDEIMKKVPENGQLTFLLFEDVVTSLNFLEEVLAAPGRARIIEQHATFLEETPFLAPSKEFIAKWEGRKYFLSQWLNLKWDGDSIRGTPTPSPGVRAGVQSTTKSQGARILKLLFHSKMLGECSYVTKYGYRFMKLSYNRTDFYRWILFGLSLITYNYWENDFIHVLTEDQFILRYVQNEVTRIGRIIPKLRIHPVEGVATRTSKDPQSVLNPGLLGQTLQSDTSGGQTITVTGETGNEGPRFVGKGNNLAPLKAGTGKKAFKEFIEKFHRIEKGLPGSEAEYNRTRIQIMKNTRQLASLLGSEDLEEKRAKVRMIQEQREFTRSLMEKRKESEHEKIRSLVGTERDQLRELSLRHEEKVREEQDQRKQIVKSAAKRTDPEFTKNFQSKIGYLARHIAQNDIKEHRVSQSRKYQESVRSISHSRTHVRRSSLRPIDRTARLDRYQFDDESSAVLMMENEFNARIEDKGIKEEKPSNQHTHQNLAQRMRTTGGGTDPMMTQNSQQPSMMPARQIMHKNELRMVEELYPIIKRQRHQFPK